MYFYQKGWDSIEGDSIAEDGYIFAPVNTTFKLFQNFIELKNSFLLNKVLKNEAYDLYLYNFFKNLNRILYE